MAVPTGASTEIFPLSRSAEKLEIYGRILKEAVLKLTKSLPILAAATDVLPPAVFGRNRSVQRG
jgi:hypothetical protein